MDHITILSFLHGEPAKSFDVELVEEIPLETEHDAEVALRTIRKLYKTIRGKSFLLFYRNKLFYLVRLTEGFRVFDLSSYLGERNDLE